MRAVAVVLLLVLQAPFTSASASSSCNAGIAWVAGCSTNGNSLTISGTQTQPSSGSPHNNPPGGGSPSTPTSPAFPVHEFDFDSCLDDWNSSRSCFRAAVDEEPTSPPPPATDEPAAPAITIDDLAQFAPDPVANVGEPDNVGVAGMPTNFVAAASAHTRSGTLLGTPLSVRFTPVDYEFVHGDGTSATSSTGGQTWSALGQAPFTPTATSHVYRERGTYQAHVTVRYAAEVDLGGGWFPVAGRLTIPGPAREIRIFEAHTALVAFTCEQRPWAPGC